MAESIPTLATRCDTCKAFWMYPCMHAGAEDIKPVCPCGGTLLAVDMEAEIKARPYVPYVAPTPAPPKK